ncbi:hypothetical protein ANN_06564 [Periplaneta americana]|uniref:Per a allergen n=1 Tax=Periplaneta americana TaxID=6978 RepID=A0ABQ8TG95_PERAM|nr:hypothetical protein ANN_06564 [Periplaneta americana]
MAGLCEGGNEPSDSLKAISVIKTRTAVITHERQPKKYGDEGESHSGLRCSPEGALENFEGEAEIGRNLLGTTYARGAEIDQLITERGEEDLAGVCR